uniref:Uncharacterized protein n=1 Tax=Oryza glumipatula TaxID=40148 RepID=A0A0E0AUY9_9ORYZ
MSVACFFRLEYASTRPCVPVASSAAAGRGVQEHDGGGVPGALQRQGARRPVGAGPLQDSGGCFFFRRDLFLHCCICSTIDRWIESLSCCCGNISTTMHVQDVICQATNRFL